MSDVSKTNEALIAEARTAAPGDDPTELAVKVHRLADALATRVPVQGEPNDDRTPEFEAIEQELFKHQPLLSMQDGSIRGCKCMDRVFYNQTEDWGTHLAEVFDALAAPVQLSSKVQDSPEIENLDGEISIPVQPSSTVDEGKIADEMERHRHVMVAPGPHQCSCSFVMSEDPGFSGWAREHKLHVARAVVEAIGGETPSKTA